MVPGLVTRYSLRLVPVFLWHAFIFLFLSTSFLWYYTYPGLILYFPCPRSRISISPRQAKSSLSPEVNHIRLLWTQDNLCECHDVICLMATLSISKFNLWAPKPKLPQRTLRYNSNICTISFTIFFYFVFKTNLSWVGRTDLVFCLHFSDKKNEKQKWWQWRPSGSWM